MVDRAIRWLADMQSSDRGWGAFDLDNTAYWLYRIPFCDFGAIIDPPSVDVTAHCVELLAREPGYERTVASGVDYLLRKQEDDGSWFGRWGVNYLYGTGATLPALAGRRSPAEPSGYSPRRGVARVPSRTATAASARTAAPTTSARPDSPGAAVGPRLPRRLRGASWGFVAAGEARSRAASRAAAWLAANQRDDGDWDEEHFTGTGFPRDFLIRYHLYRIVWPVIALARLHARSVLRAYVTGATGFVGSHVAAELRAQGADVRDERVDLLDRSGLERAVEGCDAVFHVAALYSYDAAESEFERVNVDGTRTVLEACAAKGVRRLVHTSTAGTCGPVPGREATEQDAPPDWELTVPYKRTKLAAERLVLPRRRTLSTLSSSTRRRRSGRATRSPRRPAA